MATPKASDWLIRPFAHRGLHDAGNGIIENTPSAFRAALDTGYAIELDVQPSADGEIMVFHDGSLDRLTVEKRRVDELTASELKKVRFKNTSDRMQTLAEFLEQVSGRVPALIEIKSDWGTRGPVERRLAETLKGYEGHVGVMSFDPHAVAAFASAAPGRPRGLVACDFRNRHYWGHLSRWKRFTMRHLLSAFIATPHFVAYDVSAVSAVAPRVWRSLPGRPLLTWTVRTQADRDAARRHADAMIFEGFRPGAGE